MVRTPLSGMQHSLRAGDYEAVIAGVGASLRSLTYRGRDLVVPFEADEVRPFYRGATLAPWPNRVVDGRYTFDGREHQLALTEPERGQALHGLAAWLAYDPVDKGPSHVTLAVDIEPQSGYPWQVRVTTTFSLSSEGLMQTVTATNAGVDPAPWGTGPHPYLRAASGRVDEWMLELPASHVLAVTADRLSPVGLDDVEDDPRRFDFREPRVIGEVSIDHAFTALAADADGLVTARLTDADGDGVAVVWDAACPWVQIFTGDLPDGESDPRHRTGLALEPMTCAPDALNADAYDYPTGLIELEPGDSATAGWLIQAISHPTES